MSQAVTVLKEFYERSAQAPAERERDRTQLLRGRPSYPALSRGARSSPREATLSTSCYFMVIAILNNSYY